MRGGMGAGYTGTQVAEERDDGTDRLSKANKVERVHCVDQKTGSKI